MIKLITRILFPLCLLFPITTFGETMDDLVERDGLYYKKSSMFQRIFSTVPPFTGKVNGYEKGIIKNGRREGLWVRYWGEWITIGEKDKLAWKGTFKDGEKEGPWVGYWANGQLSYKGTYKDGKLNGPWFRYHDNGQLWDKRTYKDGKKDGPWVLYYDNGQLQGKGTYKDGELDGPWEGYHKDGTVDEKWTGTWIDGKKVHNPS